MGFLAQLEARLEKEQLSFSGLVQDLLWEWMAAPAKAPRS